MRIAPLLIVSTFFCTACGPAHVAEVSSSAQVEGAVQGLSLTPREAVYAVGDFAGVAPGMLILVGDTDGLCEDMQQDRLPRNHTLLGFGLLAAPQGGDAKGRYVAGPSDDGRYLVSYLKKFDHDCQTETAPGHAFMPDTGVVEITGLIPGLLASGTFSLAFEGDEPLRGTFNARYCEAAAYLLQGGPQPSALCRD